MDIVSSQQDKLTMKLKQLGASVKTIHGLLCYVNFYIDDVRVLYLYNINKSGEYYLQRILPYPIGAGAFKDQRQIADFIKEDIAKLKNASKSCVFKKFTEVNLEIHHLIHAIEDLFMGHNVPMEKMLVIEKKLSEMRELVEEIRNSSEKIEFKK